jgi:hypothetical protein
LPEFCFILQLAIGIIFSISVVAKLRDPKSFVRGVRDYNIVGASLSGAVSFAVILLEGGLAFAHLTGWLLATFLPLGILMLLAFSLAVAVNLGRGRTLPCHCFGHGHETISLRTSFRLILIMLGEAFLLREYCFVRPWQIKLADVLLALFWAVFSVYLGSWVLGVADVRLLWRPLPQAVQERRESPFASS